MDSSIWPAEKSILFICKFCAKNCIGLVCISVSILHKNHDLGPDHAQLTLLNWDTKSVLALNKELKFPIHFQFFI